MAQPKFIKVDNFLTVYAHRCGYLDSATMCDDKSAITLGIEGNCYHVRARPYNNFERVWKTFDIDNRKEAIKLFKSLVKSRKASRNINSN